MDVPSNGLFINEPTSSEKLIYIRSLTYGVSAYFIVASEAPYKEVLTAFKDSFMDDYNNPKGVYTVLDFMSKITRYLQEKAKRNY